MTQSYFFLLQHITYVFYRFTKEYIFSYLDNCCIININPLLTSKRIKIFEYLKNYVTSNGFIFLQKTHSSVKNEKVWSDEFKGQLFFFHCKTNSCGVAIGFVGTKALNILNIKRNNLGHILVIEVKIDNFVFVLINIYNANTEPEQLHTLNNRINILETFEHIQNRSVVLDGDYNVILNPSLDSESGKPVIKKKTIVKLIQITENLDLCDISRIRSPKRKQFTFRQQHSTGFIQRRPDYFFISNSLQESFKTTDTLVAFSTDHSPITLSLRHLKEFQRGRGLWIFNKSLIKNKNYREQMKTLIKNVLDNLD